MQTQAQTGSDTVQKSEARKVGWLGLTVKLISPKKPVLCACYREGVWYKFAQPFTKLSLNDLTKGVSVLKDQHGEKPEHFVATPGDNSCFDVLHVNLDGFTEIWFPRDQFQLATDPDSV